MTHSVDILGWDFRSGTAIEPWICISDTFNSEDDALEFVQKHFGADEQGRIYLVSGPHHNEDIEPEDTQFLSSDDETVTKVNQEATQQKRYHQSD